MASKTAGRWMFPAAFVAAAYLAASAGPGHAQDSAPNSVTSTNCREPVNKREMATIRQAVTIKMDRATRAIKEDFTMTTPPYLDGPYSDGMRFYKAWQLWNRGDLARLPGKDFDVLDAMAEIEDYAHLSQLLPTYYSAHGGVRAFAQDIVATARALGRHCF